jgi:hypothetical protein
LQAGLPERNELHGSHSSFGDYKLAARTLAPSSGFDGNETYNTQEATTSGLPSR